MPDTATVQIAMPEMGESVTEGIVLEWHVAVGDFVNEGDTVVEVSTDKVDAEVPAPVSGTVTALLVEVDDEVPVGAPMLELAAGEDGRCSGRGSCRRRGPTMPPVAEASSATVPPTASPADGNGATDGNGSGNGASDVKATPIARRMAEAQGIDLGKVTPTGFGGKVTKEDVLGGENGWQRRRSRRDRRRGEAAARPGGDARQSDGREPRGADRDLVPDDRRRHPRREAQSDQRAAQRARPEDLLHPPGRLGDRRGGQRRPGDGPLLRRARRQALRDRKRPGQPRRRRRRDQERRLPHPDGPGDQELPGPRLRRLPLGLRRPDREDA